MADATKARTNGTPEDAPLADRDVSEAEHREVVIVGGGPSGFTAALYASRADLHPLVYQGPEPGGQLMTTTDVENYPGFPEGIQGPEMMQKFQEQAERFGAEVRYGTVTQGDFSERPFRLEVDEDEIVIADSVIVSSGSRARHLGLEREDELMGHGLSTCATCDGAFHRGEVMAVVGGGDSAMEEAIFLTRFAEKVYVIHRREELRASEIMAKRALDNEDIEFLWNTEVTELRGNEEDGIQSIHLVSHPEGHPKERWENGEDVEEQELELGALFYAIGHLPNTDWLEGTGLDMDEEGYVLAADGRTSETNVEGVFVAGDVSDKRYQQAVTAAGMGCMAAMDAEKWLAEQEVEREKVAS